MQLVLAYIGGAVVVCSGLFVLGALCGQWLKRSRLLMERTTEIDVRPRPRFSPPVARPDFVLHRGTGRIQ